MDYGRTIELDLPYEQAVPKVKEAFQAQGFGTLTEIDLRATLQEKLGQDMEPYVILGTCNPQLAHRALAVDREIGLLLPCNVVAGRRRHDAGPSAGPAGHGQRARALGAAADCRRRSQAHPSCARQLVRADRLTATTNTGRWMALDAGRSALATD